MAEHLPLQFRIDGHFYGAQLDNANPNVQKLDRVVEQKGNPVPFSDAQLGQTVGHTVAPFVELGICDSLVFVEDERLIAQPTGLILSQSTQGPVSALVELHVLLSFRNNG
jgi:hypothetical protein